MVEQSIHETTRTNTKILLVIYFVVFRGLFLISKPTSLQAGEEDKGLVN